MFKWIKGFVNGIVIAVYLYAIIIVAFFAVFVDRFKKPEKRKYDY